MSTIRGDQHRPRFQPSEAASIKTPKQAEAATHTAKSAKTATTAHTAAPDRAVTAKGSQATHESQALAHAKEKLVSGDSAAKFASQLKDFGNFASKLTKGFGDAGQFLNTLNGALDKTLKGLQDGMQFAEKLGGFENQLKGTFDALTNLVKTGLSILESFKGMQSGGAPPAGQPAPGTPAPAAGGAAPPAGTPAGAAPPAGTPAGAAPPAGTPAGPAAPAAPPAGTPASAPTTAGAPPAAAQPAADGKMMAQVDWKPDTHTSRTEQGPGGFNTQTDVRTSGGTTTQMKEVIEKKTVTEMQSIEKVRDLPPKEKTGSAVFYPNDIPKPGTERTVTPENKKQATDFIDKNLDDLKKPGAKLDITGLCSAPASDAYNMALGTRRAVNTREAFAQVLKDKGFSEQKINELLPKESELKSKGNHEAKSPANAGIDKQQGDRRTDVKLTVPGGQEKYTENVPVTKEVEVKKQVPVEVHKPMAVVADYNINGPGFNSGTSCEMKQDANGQWQLNMNYGQNANVNDMVKPYGVNTGNLGQWSNPYSQFFTTAVQGNPSTQPFQAPLQQFGQAIRNDVLNRPDLQGSTKKGVEAFAGRVDTAANNAMANLNSVIASFSAPSGGDGGRGPIGSPGY